MGQFDDLYFGTAGRTYYAEYGVYGVWQAVIWCWRGLTDHCQQCDDAATQSTARSTSHTKHHAWAGVQRWAADVRLQTSHETFSGEVEETEYRQYERRGTQSTSADTRHTSRHRVFIDHWRRLQKVYELMLFLVSQRYYITEYFVTYSKLSAVDE